jgi:hypothetical protein
VVLRLLPGHVHSHAAHGLLLAHLTWLVSGCCGKATAFLLLSHRPGTQWAVDIASSATPPSRASQARPEGLEPGGHRAFFFATRIEEVPHTASGGGGAAPPPPNHHPGQPAAHIAFYTRTGPGWRATWAIIDRPIWALGVLGAHFYHFLGHIPQAHAAAARGSHAGQFQLLHSTARIGHNEERVLQSRGSGVAAGGRAESRKQLGGLFYVRCV